jgi:hypothetical protein
VAPLLDDKWPQKLLLGWLRETIQFLAVAVVLLAVEGVVSSLHQLSLYFKHISEFLIPFQD